MDNVENQIILNNVCKNFGKKCALDHVDLTIEKGMFGLLGRNGAGKTTMMKLITLKQLMMILFKQILKLCTQ